MSIKKHLTLQAGTVLAGNCGQAQRPLKHKTCVVLLSLNLKWWQEPVAEGKYLRRRERGSRGPEYSQTTCVGGEQAS